MPDVSDNYPVGTSAGHFWSRLPSVIFLRSFPFLFQQHMIDGIDGIERLFFILSICVYGMISHQPLRVFPVPG